MKELKNRAIIFVALCIVELSGGFCSAGSDISQAKTNGDYVVLMHGMIRSATAMARLEWAFEDKGYRVINVTYPYSKYSIEDTAGICLAGLLKEQIHDPTVKIHFVTHSLGGIVLREYLSNNTVTNLGRVVMIAPPNHGSELVDKFRNFPFFKFFTGPAGQQLGTDPESLPEKLGPADFELGVIAGNFTLNPFYSWFLPGPDDGKVSVASTRLEGMDDFVIMPYSHTYLPWRRKVIEASVQFIEHGAFPARPSKDSAGGKHAPADPPPTFQVYASPKYAGRALRRPPE